MSARRKHLQRYQIQKILQERKIVLFYQCSNVRAEKWESIKKRLLNAITGDAIKKAEEKLLPPLTVSPSLSKGSLETFSMATPFTTLLVKNRIGQQCNVLGRLIPNFAHNLSKVGTTSEHWVRRVPMINKVDQGLSQRSSGGNASNLALLGEAKYLLIKDEQYQVRPIEDGVTSEAKAAISNSNIGLKFFQGPTFLFACNSHREMVLGCESINTKPQREPSLTLLGGIYHGKIMNHLDLIQLVKLDRRVHTSLASCLEETINCLLYNALSFHQSRLLLYLHYYATTLFDPSDTDRRSAQDCSSLMITSNDQQ